MPLGWQISATSRDRSKRLEMARLGINTYDFNDANVPEVLKTTPYILSTIGPAKLGDSVCKHYGKTISTLSLKWLGYLSSTGVYGDHDGAWVDELTPVKGNKERTKSRVVAERQWLSFALLHQIPTHVFRLGGIYGPGRGVINRLRAGMDKQTYKQGQYFSRIHVDDIARAIHASMLRPQSVEIYNVVDDLPAAAHEVTHFAAMHMGLTPPTLQDWQEANLSEMALEFYSSNKRVRAKKIKTLLPDSRWLYPSYKEGIVADIKALGLGQDV